MTQRFTVLAPTEARVLTFDFTLALVAGESLIGSPTVTATVDWGVDASPSSIIKASSISGSTVLVAVSGLQNNTDYMLTATCQTSNAQKTVTIAGVVRCAAAHS